MFVCVCICVWIGDYRISLWDDVCLLLSRADAIFFRMQVASTKRLNSIKQTHRYRITCLLTIITNKQHQANVCRTGPCIAKHDYYVCETRLFTQRMIIYLWLGTFVCLFVGSGCQWHTWADAFVTNSICRKPILAESIRNGTIIFCRRSNMDGDFLVHVAHDSCLCSARLQIVMTERDKQLRYLLRHLVDIHLLGYMRWMLGHDGRSPKRARLKSLSESSMSSVKISAPIPMPLRGMTILISTFCRSANVLQHFSLQSHRTTNGYMLS